MHKVNAYNFVRNTLDTGGTVERTARTFDDGSTLSPMLHGLAIAMQDGRLVALLDTESLSYQFTIPAYHHNVTDGYLCHAEGSIVVHGAVCGSCGVPGV